MADRETAVKLLFKSINGDYSHSSSINPSKLPQVTWFDIVANPSLIEQHCAKFRKGSSVNPSPSKLAAELLEHLSITNKASRQPEQRDDLLFRLAGRVVRAAALDVSEVQKTVPEIHQRRVFEASYSDKDKRKASNDEFRLQELNFHRWILRSIVFGRVNVANYLSGKGTTDVNNETPTSHESLIVPFPKDKPPPKSDTGPDVRLPSIPFSQSHSMSSPPPPPRPSVPIPPALPSINVNINVNVKKSDTANDNDSATSSGTGAENENETETENADEVEIEIEDLSRDGLAFSMNEPVHVGLGMEQELQLDLEHELLESDAILTAERDSVAFVEAWIKNKSKGKGKGEFEELSESEIKEGVTRTARHILSCKLTFIQTCADLADLHLARGRADAARECIGEMDKLGLTSYFSVSSLSPSSSSSTCLCCKQFCTITPSRMKGLALACSYSYRHMDMHMEMGGGEVQDLIAAIDQGRRTGDMAKLITLLTSSDSLLLPYGYLAGIESDTDADSNHHAHVIKCCNAVMNLMREDYQQQHCPYSYFYFGSHLDEVITACVAADQAKSVPRDVLCDFVSTILQRAPLLDRTSLQRFLGLTLGPGPGPGSTQAAPSWLRDGVGLLGLGLEPQLELKLNERQRLEASEKKKKQDVTDTVTSLTVRMPLGLGVPDTAQKKKKLKSSDGSDDLSDADPTAVWKEGNDRLQIESAINKVIEACKTDLPSASVSVWHAEFIRKANMLLNDGNHEVASLIFKSTVKLSSSPGSGSGSGLDQPLSLSYEAACGVFGCSIAELKLMKGTRYVNVKEAIDNLKYFADNDSSPPLHLVIDLLGLLITRREYTSVMACCTILDRIVGKVKEGVWPRPPPPKPKDDDEIVERNASILALSAACEELTDYAWNSQSSDPTTLIGSLIEPALPFDELLHKINDVRVLHVLVASLAVALRRFRILSRIGSIEMASQRYLPVMVLNPAHEHPIVPKNSVLLSKKDYTAAGKVFESLIIRLSILDPDRAGGEWYLGLGDMFFEKGEYANAAAMYVRAGVASSAAYTAPHLPRSPLLDSLAVSRLPTCLMRSDLSWGVTAALAACQLRPHADRSRSVTEILNTVGSNLEIDEEWLDCFWDMSVLQGIASRLSQLGDGDSLAVVMTVIATADVNVHNPPSLRLCVAENGAKCVLRKLYLSLCV